MKIKETVRRKWKKQERQARRKCRNNSKRKGKPTINRTQVCNRSEKGGDGKERERSEGEERKGVEGGRGGGGECRCTVHNPRATPAAYLLGRVTCRRQGCCKTGHSFFVNADLLYDVYNRLRVFKVKGFGAGWLLAEGRLCEGGARGGEHDPAATTGQRLNRPVGESRQTELLHFEDDFTGGRLYVGR